jgi:hypothetical protein
MAYELSRIRDETLKNHSQLVAQENSSMNLKELWKHTLRMLALTTAQRKPLLKAAAQPPLRVGEEIGYVIDMMRKARCLAHCTPRRTIPQTPTKPEKHVFSNGRQVHARHQGRNN